MYVHVCDGRLLRGARGPACGPLWAAHEGPGRPSDGPLPGILFCGLHRIIVIIIIIIVIIIFIFIIIVSNESSQMMIASIIAIIAAFWA